AVDDDLPITRDFRQRAVEIVRIHRNRPRDAARVQLAQYARPSVEDERWLAARDHSAQLVDADARCAQRPAKLTVDFSYRSREPPGRRCCDAPVSKGLYGHGTVVA